MLPNGANLPSSNSLLSNSAPPNEKKLDKEEGNLIMAIATATTAAKEDEELPRMNVQFV